MTFLDLEFAHWTGDVFLCITKGFSRIFIRFGLGLDNSILLNSANFLIGAQGKGSNIFSLQK